MSSISVPQTVLLNGVTRRGGTWVNSALELEKRADGTWHATKFGDVMLDTYNASKRDASQAGGGTASQTELSDQEIAELAGKYDLHNMTQDQYDAFLDNLIEKGALSRFDAMRLGHHGFRILDIDPEAFASGGTCGTAYVHSSSVDRLKQSLEDTDGDLLRWLENMLARLSLGIDPSTEAGSRQTTEAVNALRNIIQRMQAAA